MVTTTALEHELKTVGEQWHATLASAPAFAAQKSASASAATWKGSSLSVERKNGWQLAEHLGDAGP